jgi:hypothetical protein
LLKSHLVVWLALRSQLMHRKAEKSLSKLGLAQRRNGLCPLLFKQSPSYFQLNELY